MKQVKVYILDETGHSEAVMAPAEALGVFREQRQQGKWCFADGQLLDEAGERDMAHYNELLFTHPLVAGCGSSS